jgi:hypothetical protein
LNGENKRRVTNVKGAERISFSVRHAAFLLFMGDEGKTDSHLPFAILRCSLAAVARRARRAMTNENSKWKMKNGYSLRCFRH